MGPSIKGPTEQMKVELGQHGQQSTGGVGNLHHRNVQHDGIDFQLLERLVFIAVPNQNPLFVLVTAADDGRIDVIRVRVDFGLGQQGRIPTAGEFFAYVGPDQDGGGRLFHLVVKQLERKQLID